MKKLKQSDLALKKEIISFLTDADLNAMNGGKDTSPPTLPTKTCSSDYSIYSNCICTDTYKCESAITSQAQVCCHILTETINPTPLTAECTPSITCQITEPTQ